MLVVQHVQVSDHAERHEFGFPFEVESCIVFLVLAHNESFHSGYFLIIPLVIYAMKKEEALLGPRLFR